MTDFKPCPFCERTDIRMLPLMIPTGVKWSICCYACRARFPNRRRELVAAAWNRRQHDKKPPGEPGSKD